VIGSKLYVPVTRGIAVVDLKTGKRLPPIALTATPVALAAGPGNRLFAALFSTGKVAVVSPGRKPVLVAAGKGPVALATAGGNVYVVNAGTGTVRRLDGSSGAAGPSTRVAGIATVKTPIVVKPPAIATRGRTVTVTVPLAGGALAANQLAVVDGKIAAGHAQVLLWQGGIRAHGSTKTGHGVAVKTSTGPGRVRLTLGVKAGDFTRLAVVRSAGGHAVVFTLTQKPAPPPVTTTTPPVTTSTPPVTTSTPPPTTTSTPPPTTTSPPVTHTTPPPTTTSTPPPTHTTPPPTHTTTQTFTVR